jgi:hypothetical protein
MNSINGIDRIDNSEARHDVTQLVTQWNLKVTILLNGFCKISDYLNNIHIILRLNSQFYLKIKQNNVSPCYLLYEKLIKRDQIVKTNLEK